MTPTNRLRQEFEAWAGNDFCFDLNLDGSYEVWRTDCAWQAWQAATAAERERADRDARRYQWIRSRCRADAFDAGVEWEWYEQDPDTLDAVIDAAMKE